MNDSKDNCIQHFRRIIESNITRTTYLTAALELWNADIRFILLTMQAPPHQFLDTYADKELIKIIFRMDRASQANHIEGLSVANAQLKSLC